MLSGVKTVASYAEKKKQDTLKVEGAVISLQYHSLNLEICPKHKSWFDILSNKLWGERLGGNCELFDVLPFTVYLKEQLKHKRLSKKTIHSLFSPRWFLHNIYFSWYSSTQITQQCHSHLHSTCKNHLAFLRGCKNNIFLLSWSP